MDYLFESLALDQQWIRAMLWLSNKATSLMIQIEKQYMLDFIQQVINTQRQRGYMLDYRLFPTKYSSKY